MTTPHSVSRRSTTGCLTCGVRAKKCDEKWAQDGCKECTKLRIECVRVEGPRILSKDIRGSSEMSACTQEISKAVKDARKRPEEKMIRPLPAVRTFAIWLTERNFSGLQVPPSYESPQAPYLQEYTHNAQADPDPFAGLHISTEATPSSTTAAYGHFVGLPDIHDRLLACDQVLHDLARVLGCYLEPAPGVPDGIPPIVSILDETGEDGVRLAEIISGVILGCGIMSTSLGRSFMIPNA
ncbi:uncharacterized protein EI90DRAFT_3044089 [Cantharellus anzutake]|uniref:uncharacterized protein n=1 Tax=Cantharellus anzutake TaxID=1750568 RepID=UPI00190766D5|nr:uncharacterized protein EI90DRAFT_3044089 [Cantharellus anzutake]KAF8336910.1 hypothetical protein EI90DRAFT_3044089 [Cantharellus anzutake]